DFLRKNFMNNVNTEFFAQHRGLFIFWGILLMILGLLAISFASFTTLISVISLGLVIIFGGIVFFADTFKFWRINWSTFFFHLVIGLLYIAAGAVLITQPLTGALSLTFLLGA